LLLNITYYRYYFTSFGPYHYSKLERQAIQLEEEKKRHAEELEWERIRKEQEEQARQEEILAAQRAKQQIQLHMVDNFFNTVAQRSGLILYSSSLIILSYNFPHCRISTARRHKCTTASTNTTPEPPQGKTASHSL
jgi:hypothetical protein